MHLFGWPWAAIGRECTEQLGPAGYGAVQVVPPQEHAVLPGDPWWQRYQPVSYRIDDRTGFAAMVAACHAAGVRVYADAVLNHMTAQPAGVGSAGTAFRRDEYPGVYAPADFHHCDAVRAGGPAGNDGILDWTSRFEVQNCALLGLSDLATETAPVRDRLAGYLNDLISLGVDGFRIDAAKHIPADDLAAILGRLDRPAYVYQEVLYAPGQPVRPAEYRATGTLVEARYGPELSRIMRSGSLQLLADLGRPLGIEGVDLEPPATAMTYVDSHDSQRDGSTLSYRDGATYLLAVAFLLAHPYGTPMVLSGYAFDTFDDGPPAEVRCAPDAFGCEHRVVAGLVGLHNAVAGTPVVRWWATDDQVGFGRGTLGYVVLNRAAQPFTRTVATGLPAGTYCDVVHGGPRGGRCTGATVRVDGAGWATVTVPAQDALAIDHLARA